MLKLYALATRAFLRLTGARRQVLEDGPVSLVYYSVGPAEGEPWVLLHGLGAVAATWAPVMRALGRGCRVIVPELSALGGTRAPRAGLGGMGGGGTVARALAQVPGGRSV